MLEKSTAETAPDAPMALYVGSFLNLFISGKTEKAKEDM